MYILLIITFSIFDNNTTKQSQTKLLHTKLHGSKEKEAVQLQKAYTTGTLVEFSEKKRVRIGQIVNVEHKSNGGARYDLEDQDGHRFQIADKAINYAMPISPNDAKNLKHIFDTFAMALEEPDVDLQNDLDISPDLLEMAWEEALGQEETHHELTPNSLIELVHSHAASGIEAYKAWRLMRSDISHIFFKEIKDHGKVVSFKAKAKKAVDAAKITFCQSPEQSDNDFCWV